MPEILNAIWGIITDMAVTLFVMFTVILVVVPLATPLTMVNVNAPVSWVHTPVEPNTAAFVPATTTLPLVSEKLVRAVTTTVSDSASALSHLKMIVRVFTAPGVEVDPSTLLVAQVTLGGAVNMCNAVMLVLAIPVLVLRFGTSGALRAAFGLVSVKFMAFSKFGP